MRFSRWPHHVSCPNLHFIGDRSSASLTHHSRAFPDLQQLQPSCPSPTSLQVYTHRSDDNTDGSASFSHRITQIYTCKTARYIAANCDTEFIDGCVLCVVLSPHIFCPPVYTGGGSNGVVQFFSSFGMDTGLIFVRRSSSICHRELSKIALIAYSLSGPGRGFISLCLTFLYTAEDNGSSNSLEKYVYVQRRRSFFHYIAPSPGTSVRCIPWKERDTLSHGVAHTRRINVRE